MPYVNCEVPLSPVDGATVTREVNGFGDTVMRVTLPNGASVTLIRDGNGTAQIGARDASGHKLIPYLDGCDLPQIMWHIRNAARAGERVGY